MKIKSIQIRNFWKKGNVSWDLDPQVNVVVGNNGSGKSTILKLVDSALKTSLTDEDKNLFALIDEMIICLTNDKNEDYYIYIDSFGNRTPDVLETPINEELISTFDISSSLDDLIEETRIRFLTYETSVLKKIEKLFFEGKSLALEEINREFGKRKALLDKLNELFQETDKYFSENQSTGVKNGEEKYFKFKIKDQEYELNHTQLSSGEKQIFYLLLITMLQDDKPWILLLDEPEISLHIDWQQKLISYLTEMNPNCQFVFVTHSPNIFFPEWGEKMKNINEILSQKTNISRVRLPSKEAKITHEIKKIVTENPNKPRQLSQFNIFLNREFVLMSYGDCEKTLAFMKQDAIKPDMQTYTILISKLTEEADAFKLLRKVETEKVKTWGNINAVYNATLKKINKFEDRISFIEKMNTQRIPLDIITFSTLLGKAETEEQVKIVEDYRKRFNIEPNEIYKHKLKIKQ